MAPVTSGNARALPSLTHEGAHVTDGGISVCFFYVERRNIGLFVFLKLIIVIFLEISVLIVKTNKKNILYAVISECDEERFVAAR